MFTTEERDELRDRVIELAREDDRVVGAAEVGSLALGEGDRWSDIDLTFAVDAPSHVSTVLGEWTNTFVEEWGAVQLFDLAVGPTIYRVFMFADCLQLDISLSPSTEFVPTSPRFRLIFGTAGELVESVPADPAGFVGWAVMWSRHARVCIERDRLRQAEHAIFRLRESALDYACARRGLRSGYGRGLEELPAVVHDGFALVLSFEQPDLTQALKTNVAGLIAECAEGDGADQRTRDRLSEIVADL